MRTLIFITFALAITACGGENQAIQPPLSDTILAEKSSQGSLDGTPIDISNGITQKITEIYWQLDTPVHLNFSAPIREHINAPESFSMYEQRLSSTLSFFKVDMEGKVTTYTLFEAELQDIVGDISYETCLHEQPDVEYWHYLKENRFRVYNKGQSIEVSMDFDTATLEIEQRNGTLLYRNAELTQQDFDAFPACHTSPKDQIPSYLILNHIKRETSHLKGLWLTSNNTEPMSIAYTGTSSKDARRQYIEFDDNGNGKTLLYNEKRQCFIDTKERIKSTNDQTAFKTVTYSKGINSELNHQVYGVNLTSRTSLYGNDSQPIKALYFRYLQPTPRKTPAYLTWSTVAQTAKGNMCELSQEEFEQLSPAVEPNEIIGIWSLFDEKTSDLKYLHITDKLKMIRYDYRGDSYNNGISCFLESDRSEAIYLGTDSFEEVHNQSNNNLISFFVSDIGELVIKSKDQQGDEYNRLLTRASELEALDSLSLCPSIRN